MIFCTVARAARNSLESVRAACPSMFCSSVSPTLMLWRVETSGDALALVLGLALAFAGGLAFAGAGAGVFADALTAPLVAANPNLPIPPFEPLATLSPPVGEREGFL